MPSNGYFIGLFGLLHLQLRFCTFRLKAYIAKVRSKLNIQVIRCVTGSSPVTSITTGFSSVVEQPTFISARSGIATSWPFAIFIKSLVVIL